MDRFPRQGACRWVASQFIARSSFAVEGAVFSWLHGAISGILAGGILGFGTADRLFVLHLRRDLAVMSGWLCDCFLQDLFNSPAHKLPSLTEHVHRNGVFLVFLFSLVVFFGVFFCFPLFCLLVFLLVGHPCLDNWTAYLSTLSFDSPMREYTRLCTIRSMAQTLCYDLARAEKAKDGKKMDILEDGPFEDLLRVAASGKVGYGAARPSCCEYSRLKLRQDDGPKALRSPDHLSGLPNLKAWELQRVQESFTMLSRCVEVLYKAWMLASSFSGLCSLGSLCPHPPNSHVRLQGLRDDTGAFASRATAQYPIPLAQKFVVLVGPLLDNSAVDLQWSLLNYIMPIKQLSDYPFAQIDGGEAFSHPDWSQDQRQEQDWFHEFRTSWMRRIVSDRLDKILLSHVASGSSLPPFSQAILQPFKEDLEKFLVSHGHQPDWSVRKHQPIQLRILHSLQRIMHDFDFTLFPSLLEGVRTGFSTAIPPSGIFPHEEPTDVDSEPLSAHLSNWQSADDDLTLTRKLVQEEIDQSWVFAYPGSLEDAQQEYPAGVAIGKLGVARAEGRAPGDRCNLLTLAQE